MRADLQIDHVGQGAQFAWTIQDTVTLRYFQLREEEYFILRQLDGHADFEELRRSFEDAFAPVKLSQSELRGLIDQFVAHGLVLVDDVREGLRLWRRHQLQHSRQRWSQLSNPLAIRFAGIDPSRVLDRVYPWCAWMLSPLAVGLALMIQLAAIVLLLVHAESFSQRLPTLESFMQPGNWLRMLLAVALLKVLHEFGHALTCKHFGGRCHEMGVLLLVGIPCLYTNVSASWREPSRWKRAAISGAGIFVECQVAAICVFLWWFSEPGFLNTAFLSLAIVGSLNSVLINGNPLLRYDGYYVLSDLTNISNLRQRSGEALLGLITRWVLGESLGRERMLPSRGRVWLVVYAIVSRLYSWLVIFGIFWFLVQLLRPLGLVIVAYLLGMLIVSTTLMTWYRQIQELMLRNKRKGVSDRSAFRGPLVLLSLLGLLLTLFLVPLPHHVSAPLLLEPAAAKRVYVGETGRLPLAGADPRSPSQRFAFGDLVQQGETLVRLENALLDSSVLKLQGDVAELQSRIESLERTQAGRPETAAQLMISKEAIGHLQTLLDQRIGQQGGLALVAPVAGRVLPFHPVATQLSRDGELTNWSGTPLDAENLGCTLERGTVYCLIGDERSLAARMVVAERDLPFLKPGAQVSAWVHQLPGCSMRGVVSDLGTHPLTTIPEELSSLEFPKQQDGDHWRSTDGNVHLVSVRMEDAFPSLPLYATGWARIETQPVSLFQRIYRAWTATFRFQR
jgi:putative peptide zinc metalloprotease protein